MALGNFYAIMEGIIGAPQNDVESTILYFMSALLGISIILIVFKMFDIASGLIKPK